MSCVENLVGFYSNHMVFRQNLSPVFREPNLFFRGDEFYKNLLRELSRRTVPFEEEIFTIWEYRHEDIESIIKSILYCFEGEWLGNTLGHSYRRWGFACSFFLALACCGESNPARRYYYYYQCQTQKTKKKSC